MDLTQNKLTRTEWESIEMPCSASEQILLNLVKDGFHNTNITQNNASTIISFLKLEATPALHNYMFGEHFEKRMKEISLMFQSVNISVKMPEISKKLRMPCNADRIRLERAGKISSETRSTIFEFTICKHIENLATSVSKDYSSLSKKVTAEGAGNCYIKNNPKWMNHFYALSRLCSISLASKANHQLMAFARNVISAFTPYVDIAYMIEHAAEYVESDSLMYYDDLRLYSHQKQIFDVMSVSKKVPKLVLYSAPTGTGKTVTPIGIAEKKRVIFVCAARHVGLALAKAAISVGRRVAFAFGCQTADDIRLHYAAAVDFTKNRRSGAIQKVDNSQGEKVEMLICDIASYLPSMHYMLAFNSAEDLVFYWDEPTISLDQDEHPLHEIIARNWSENLIPTVVLSTATLPTSDELSPVISAFQTNFPGAQIIDIASHECRKTVPLLDFSGRIVLPHHLDSDYNQAVNRAQQCLKNARLLRYIDVEGATKFIGYVEKHRLLSIEQTIGAHFTKVLDITPTAIKKHYLQTIINLNSIKWEMVKAIPRIVRIPPSEGDSLSGIRLTTKDAHTLSDGPTIYLANDVEKIARFLLKEAAIPSTTMQEIGTRIASNNNIADKITLLEQEIEDLTAQDVRGGKKKSGNKDNKDDNMDADETGTKNPKIALLTSEISAMYSHVKPIMLNDVFVPNTLAHRDKWGSKIKDKGNAIGTPFTSTIIDNKISSSLSKNKCSTCGRKGCMIHVKKDTNRETNVVTEVSSLSGVNDAWKILLLMGIGVFGGNAPPAYTEIVKRLADQQRLYLTIAASDYIYGTNFQYCHGFIGKDIQVTHEKIVQAMGRVGRHSNQNHTIRFRTDEHISTLFALASNEMGKEATNMNRLLSCINV